jgi:hypothetical protein
MEKLKLDVPARGWLLDSGRALPPGTSKGCWIVEKR